MNYLAALDSAINHLPYIEPIHPNLVHFTIGLFYISIPFDILGMFYREEKPIMGWFKIGMSRADFFDIGWWNMLAAAVFTFFTVAAGIFEMILASPPPTGTSAWGLPPLTQMIVHGLSGILILLLYLLLAMWRGMQRYVWRKNQPQQVQWLYLLAGVATMGLVLAQGELGGQLGADFGLHNTAANLLQQAEANTPVAVIKGAEAKHSTVVEAMVYPSANLPIPKFNRQGQTLFYGTQSVVKLNNSINWETLLSRLNERTWNPNQLRLNQSSEPPTISLGNQPLLQAPDLAVAQIWLYKLQGALL